MAMIVMATTTVMMKMIRSNDSDDEDGDDDGSGVVMLVLLIVQLVCPEQAMYNGDGGTISSTNYPSVYANNANCHYYITTTEGMFAALSFNAFDVEANYDHVYVYSGHEANAANQLGL